ncbi:hypothetical protein P692DRAFT_20736883, partial [Suillus brevipes Sb2]
IDISADNTLLASGSFDETARIWNLDTGKLVAGLFKSEELVSAVRFSPDSKKLAVLSWTSKSLEVWDVQSQRFKFASKTVGTPFEGHTDRMTSLALLFDDALLASFDVQDIYILVL